MAAADLPPADAAASELLPTVQVSLANLHHAEDVRDLLSLLNEYAQTPAGGEHPLPAAVQQRIVPGLLQLPGSFVLLARDGVEPVGVAVCLPGFSTFAGQPLVNVHDLAVTARARGRGIGSLLLNAVCEEAHRRGCCKVTLEVREFNDRAEALYRRLGFIDPSGAPTRFLERPLPVDAPAK
jgi:ribosomal protein S18 acetylase RimI-like enzyme